MTLTDPPPPDFDELTGGFSREYGVEEITAADLLRRLNGESPPLLFDVRTSREQSVSTIAGAILIQPGMDPTKTQAYREFRVGPGAPGDCIVFCTGGKRSAMAAADAKATDDAKRVLNLRGGLIAYANLGGKLVHPETGEPTLELHGYNEKWAAYIEAPTRGVLLPAIPPPEETQPEDTQKEGK